MSSQLLQLSHDSSRHHHHRHQHLHCHRHLTERPRLRCLLSTPEETDLPLNISDEAINDKEAEEAEEEEGDSSEEDREGGRGSGSADEDEALSGCHLKMTADVATQRQMKALCLSSKASAFSIAALLGGEGGGGGHEGGRERGSGGREEDSGGENKEDMARPLTPTDDSSSPNAIPDRMCETHDVEMEDEAHPPLTTSRNLSQGFLKTSINIIHHYRHQSIHQLINSLVSQSVSQLPVSQSVCQTSS